MEDMEPGEVAAMYHEGENALIMVTSDRSIPDVDRCAAVNRLLSRVKAQPGAPTLPTTTPRLTVIPGSVPAVGVFFPHLGQQVTSAAG